MHIVPSSSDVLFIDIYKYRDIGKLTYNYRYCPYSTSRFQYLTSVGVSRHLCE